MRDVILALDMGGTSIKQALIDAMGQPLEASMFAFHGDSREAIFQTILDALTMGATSAKSLDCRVTRIGVACPGPFDFRNGVSLMTHKWAGINGLPLPPVFSEVFPEIPISFLHDSTAFILGEAFGGAARDAQNPAGVMLGTGFGYTYMRDRRVCLDNTLSPLVRLWRLPYRDGTVEDYVSRRAIRKRYADKTGDVSEPPDVKEIACRAVSGEPEAVTTFNETGALLGDLLRSHLPKACDLVVLGGQIAQSAALLLPDVRRVLSVPIVPAMHIADAALRGIGCYCTHEDVTCILQE